MKREYKSGSRWALWRWTFTDSGYLTRLHLIKTPWFSICLHWLNGPDPEPWAHDHPVTFLSVILKGWYQERRWKRGQRDPNHPVHHWFNWIRATPLDRHTICTVAHGGALTLCFMGPKTREWGFHTDRGWVGWQDYYRKQRAERVAKGEQP